MGICCAKDACILEDYSTLNSKTGYTSFKKKKIHNSNYLQNNDPIFDDLYDMKYNIFTHWKCDPHTLEHHM